MGHIISRAKLYFQILLLVWTTGTASAEVSTGEIWGNPFDPAKGWASSPSESCPLLGLTVIPGQYYDGLYYNSNVSADQEYMQTCIDDFGETSWTALYCEYTDDQGDTDPSNDTVTRIRGTCPDECVTCSLGAGGSSPGTARGAVGNPIELATQVKVERSTDWRSALDSRFSISRNYRSNDDFYNGYNA